MLRLFVDDSDFAVFAVQTVVYIVALFMIEYMSDRGAASSCFLWCFVDRCLLSVELNIN